MTNYTENLSYNGVNVSEPPTYADLANATGNLETQTLATEIGTAIGPQTVGTRPLTGIALLAVLGFGLYQNQTSLDTTAAVMIPTAFTLTQFGLLPFGTGILTGLAIAVSAFVAVAAARVFT